MNAEEFFAHLEEAGASVARQPPAAADDGSVSSVEDEAEVAPPPAAATVDVWETLNPESDYAAPKIDAEKGSLQKFMEDARKLKPTQTYPYTYMLCQIQFRDWAIVQQKPYLEYESEQVKDKKLRGHQSLKPAKDLIVREIKRRNPAYKASAKNKTSNELIATLSQPEMKLVDAADIAYLKYRERDMRDVLSNFLKSKFPAATSSDSTAIATSNMTRGDRMRAALLFTDNHIVDAYRQTQLTKDQLALDGRNSVEYLQAQFDAKAVSKFNDPSWIPRSKSYPLLHEHFTDEVEYPFRDSK